MAIDLSGAAAGRWPVLSTAAKPAESVAAALRKQKALSLSLSSYLMMSHSVIVFFMVLVVYLPF